MLIIDYNADLVAIKLAILMLWTWFYKKWQRLSRIGGLKRLVFVNYPLQRTQGVWMPLKNLWLFIPAAETTGCSC
jgi:hypothetical protein